MGSGFSTMLKEEAEKQKQNKFIDLNKLLEAYAKDIYLKTRHRRTTPLKKLNFRTAWKNVKIVHHLPVFTEKLDPLCQNTKKSKVTYSQEYFNKSSSEVQHTFKQERKTKCIGRISIERGFHFDEGIDIAVPKLENNPAAGNFPSLITLGSSKNFSKTLEENLTWSTESTVSVKPYTGKRMNSEVIEQENILKFTVTTSIYHAPSQGPDQMTNASSAPSQGTDQMTNASSAPSQGTDQMTNASSAPSQGTDQMTNASGATSQSPEQNDECPEQPLQIFVTNNTTHAHVTPIQGKLSEILRSLEIEGIHFHKDRIDFVSEGTMYFKFDINAEGKCEDIVPLPGQTQLGDPRFPLPGPAQAVCGPGGLLSAPVQVVCGPGGLLPAPAQAVCGPGGLLPTPTQAVCGPGVLLPCQIQAVCGPGGLLPGQAQGVGGPGAAQAVNAPGVPLPCQVKWE